MAITLVGERFKLTSGDDSSVWSPHPSETVTLMQFNTIEDTVLKHEQVIGDYDGEQGSISQIAQTAYTINQKIVGTNGLESQVSQLSNSWALTLKNGNDVKTAINATTSGIRLKSDLIHLSGNTYVDGTFTVGNANIVNLQADKISGGTLNFANINAVNLNVNSVSGFSASWIRTLWNGINSSMTADGSGLRVSNVDGRVAMMNNLGEFRSDNGDGVYGILGAGRSQYYGRTNGSLFYIGSNFEERDLGGIWVTHNQTFRIGRYNDYVSTNPNATQQPYLSLEYETPNDDVSGIVRSHKTHVFNKNIEFRGAIRTIDQAYGINFQYGGSIYALSNNSQLRIQSSSSIQFGTDYNWALMIDNYYMYSYRNLSMEGHTITGSPSLSDERLKDDFKTLDNSLDKIRQFEYGTFIWKESGKLGIGFKAQQVASIIPDMMVDTASGYLGYDEQSYTNVLGHAIQDLDRETNERISKLEAEIAYLKGA